MSVAEKKQRKKYACFADYVVDVPRLIINPRFFTLYDRLQMLGSVSNFVLFAQNQILFHFK